MTMTPRLRLALCIAVILMSATYALLVKQDPNTASAIAVGYVAFLVTVITALQIWRRP